MKRRAFLAMGAALPLASNPLLTQLRTGQAGVSVEDVTDDELVRPEHCEWIGTGIRSARPGSASAFDGIVSGFFPNICISRFPRYEMI